MTPGKRVTSLLAATAAALALGGCGDADTGDPIPNGVAQGLNADLDEFQRAIDDGECDTIDARIQELRSELGTLDERGVGSDVQNALLDGVTNLRTLANDVCDQPDEEVETTPTETVTTPTETVTTPTETTTTPTTTTPTTTTDPDEGDGGGQFDPGDGGAGPDAEGPPGQLKKDGDR